MRTGYGAVAKILHWLTALLVVSELGLAFFMEELHGDARPLGYMLHRSLGAALLALTLMRLAWRLAHPPHIARNAMPRYAARAAGCAHAALYFLLLAIPLAGWAADSAQGKQTMIFALGALPALGGKNPALGHMLREAHEYMAFALMALIGLHVAAALYHRFVLRDNVLQHMLPRKR